MSNPKKQMVHSTLGIPAELAPSQSVNPETIRRALAGTFDPTVGPVRPDELDGDFIRGLLRATFDRSVGPVRPSEIRRDVIREVLKSVNCESRAEVGND